MSLFEGGIFGGPGKQLPLPVPRKKQMKEKDFNELTKEELEELEELLAIKAKEEGRELLRDVVCAKRQSYDSEESNELLKMQTYEEFEASLSPEVKERCKKAFEGFKQEMLSKGIDMSKPLLCGPEARAWANGTQDQYYKDNEKYLRKVNLKDFN